MSPLPYELSQGDYPNDLDPGEWAVRDKLPVFACPACGRTQGLPPGSQISDMGNVVPVAPLACCGFHRALRLWLWGQEKRR